MELNLLTSFLPLLVLLSWLQPCKFESVPEIQLCPYLNGSIDSLSHNPVIIPGFEKCGTTELFSILNISGCFNVAHKKELKFLNRFCVPKRVVSGKKIEISKFKYCPAVRDCMQLSDYLQCWPGALAAPPLDGTPAYSHTILLKQKKLVSAAKELNYLSPLSKSIWLLRNPVERTISSYHFFRVGDRYEKCTLVNKINQEITFLKENDWLTKLFLNSPSDVSEDKMALAWARLRSKFRKFGYRSSSAKCPATPEIVIGSLYLPMLVHWVSTIKFAQHMILSSDYFFANSAFVVSEYILPFIFESKEVRKLQSLEKKALESHVRFSNRGNYVSKNNDANCLLACFYSPFTVNLRRWIEFYEKKRRIVVHPATDVFHWDIDQSCHCK